MSIAASVLASDLFGMEPLDIPFKERISVLKDLLSRFLVISEEKGFQMKVDNDQIPILEFMENARKEKMAKNPKNKNSDD